MAPEVATLVFWNVACDFSSSPPWLTQEVATLRLPKVATLRLPKVVTLLGGNDEDIKTAVSEVMTLSLHLKKKYFCPYGIVKQSRLTDLAP